MIHLYSIPTAALVLLNAIVIYYVLRERKRTRSGFFLLTGAIALILWAVGLEMWRVPDSRYQSIQFNALAMLAVGASLFHFASTRSKLPNPVWGRSSVIVALYLSCLILPLTHTPSGPALAGVARISQFFYSSWAQLWAAEGGLPLLVSMAWLLATCVLLVRPSVVESSARSRSLPRHLLLATLGPALFFLLFAITTTLLQPRPLLPSPGLMMAVVAQLAILVVIRQEEVQRPLYLSRWIFYSSAVIVGFFISHLLFSTYESIVSRTLVAPVVHNTILITILVVLLTVSIPAVQGFFDRLLFRRAWEYRELVREAQAELHETRQRLRRAERLSVVGELAARVAHEIKNPLGPIKGYTQMMADKLSRMEDFPQRASFLRHLAIISEEVETIDSKVRHLLDLSRKTELTAGPEDVNRIVRRAATLLHLEAELLERERSVRVEIAEELDDSLPPIECQRVRIEESFFNLCRNAFEALGAGGTIVLRTVRRADPNGRDGVALEVEDNGPGLTAAAREHLFEPFFTEKPDGTGLGLSIVRSHIELHGGVVQFSNRPNGGTIASLWIPLVQPTPAVGGGGPVVRRPEIAEGVEEIDRVEGADSGVTQAGSGVGSRE